MDKAISIYFSPSDFKNNKKVFGRTSANHSMLKALLKYGSHSSIALYTEQMKFFDNFRQNYIKEIEDTNKSIYPIMWGDIPALQRMGLYIHTDPALTQISWARSFINPAAFSLCGLVHSLSSYEIAQEIGKLIFAPIHHWDALVCTSNAAKKVIENLFLQWFDYLNLKNKSSINLQLPIIPLGINLEDVTANDKHNINRINFRKKYQIADNDFVILFFGRLFFYEKAHPIPTYLAIEELARRVGSKAKVHFIQAGWFENTSDLTHYKEAAKIFSPSVNTIFITNIDSNAKKKEIWPGADVFMSLADNFQETFGITPLEAMANRLPVIVSDWDGYKDTVRHQIDGFCIPTILPPSGCGVDLSLGYLTHGINYQTYSGLCAQMNAVDLKACIDALWQLYQFPALRKKMGDAGYERVQKHFVWEEIIKKYDALWTELLARRQVASVNLLNPIPAPPMFADPYLTFAEYGSITLKAQQVLVPGLTNMKHLSALDTNYLSSFGMQQRLPGFYLEKIVSAINQHSLNVQQIVELIAQQAPQINSGIIVRSLTYLIKYDFLRIG